MTVSDLRCDWCGYSLAGLAGAGTGPGRLGVRFTYHPGSPALRDNSGLLCSLCWDAALVWLGPSAVAPQVEPATEASVCSVCRDRLDEGRLVVTRTGQLTSYWLLCRAHAVEFLNRLRTVEPKLDPGTFSFPPVPRP